MSTQNSPPKIVGLHHVKLPAKNIAETHHFYTVVLGFKALPHLTHKRADGTAYALLAQSPGEDRTIVEIRDAHVQAASQAGSDPITWAVDTRADLDLWATWLEKQGFECSRVLRGVLGWVLVTIDPDGRMVRLYTREEHEWESAPDWDERWLGKRE